MSGLEPSDDATNLKLIFGSILLPRIGPMCAAETRHVRWSAREILPRAFVWLLSTSSLFTKWSVARFPRTCRDTSTRAGSGKPTDLVARKDGIQNLEATDSRDVANISGVARVDRSVTGKLPDMFLKMQSVEACSSAPA